MSRQARHDIDWRPAVARVAWIPAEHRSAQVPPAVAMRVLRCTEASYHQLLELGLPVEDGPDGPVHDLCDLKNVGLYSGTGATEIEMAMTYILAYMREGPDDLTRPRSWGCRLHLVSDAHPTRRTPRRVYRPSPEAFGGELGSWAGEDGTPPPTDAESFELVQGSRCTGTLTSRGAPDTVASPAIRAIATELNDSGVRWHYLPRSLEARPHEATALGVGSCATLAAVLEERLVDAGYQARAYHGWIVTASEIDHGWVEVVDDDGRAKCLDPSFAALATGNGFGTPEFRDFVTGARLNRVIPTRAPLRDSFVVGAGPAGDPGGGDTVSFACRLQG